MTKDKIFLCACSIGYLAVRKLGSIGHFLRMDKDGGYEHVPSSNLFRGLYQHTFNRK